MSDASPEKDGLPQRIAAIVALIAFALCLFQGLSADNTFSTTVARALVAMAGTYVIGLVIGLMARRMLEDSPKPEPEKVENSVTKTETSDR